METQPLPKGLVGKDIESCDFDLTSPEGARAYAQITQWMICMRETAGKPGEFFRGLRAMCILTDAETASSLGAALIYAGWVTLEDKQGRVFGAGDMGSVAPGDLDYLIHQVTDKFNTDITVLRDACYAEAKSKETE